jgi:GT2 family glycosyltransferase/glycosyltransferase involved in cell wall biosynthesis
MRHVDVVIPVYDGYQETVACLASVLRSVDGDWARIVVINDCSPNPQITEYLRQLDATQTQLTLLENEKNLGFVATANRGMAYDDERDVLLLNSDVEVAGDWLHRLREAAYHHELVASVTPFSNNATICSFPNLCENNRLIFDLPLDEIDAQFAAIFSVDDVFQVPTGVGCCMYIRRDCLNKIGFFDFATFGRGYGEENDWCQRAAQSGWRNLHLANCFVYHKGGVSFGSENKPGVVRAQGILDKKHPRYHADIQDYIAADPAREARTRAWLTLFASQDKPKVLMISHKLGGGALQHVEELAQLFCDRALFLLMIPDKDGETVRLSCFDGKRRLKDGLFFDVATDYGKLVDLLRSVGIGRVHFHHTLGLPTRLWVLADDLGCDYDFTVHDYYLVNANPTLTDKDARYVSEALLDFDWQCASHYPLPEGVDGDQWRVNQRLIVEGADRLIFPSFDCSERFHKFFDVKNLIVAWHTDYAQSCPYPEPQWHFPEGRPLRVLVLGALSREKGADVLEVVASELVGQNIEFHLLGYAYRGLGASVIYHGPYDNREVHSLVQGIAPDVVWFPALWPETYSYTLSIALHNGLPVVVPDIGAFAERVRGRPYSTVVNWRRSTAEWRRFWKAVLREKALPGFVDRCSTNRYSVDHDFYSAQYLQAVPVRPASPGAGIPRSLGRNLYADSPDLSRSERVLNAIWIFSRQPVIAKLISIVPFRVQRSIKRFLSHRPIHDIVGK